MFYLEQIQNGLSFKWVYKQRPRQQRNHNISTMELGKKSADEIECFWSYYLPATKLAKIIDCPNFQRHIQEFETCLHRNKDRFPLFYAEFGDPIPQLNLLNRDERLQIKLKLFDEVKNKLEKTREEVFGKKMLQNTALPCDTEECKRRLDEMLEEGRRKIEEIEETRRQIEHAKEILHYRVEVNKSNISMFNEKVFTDMPEAVGKERAKLNRAAEKKRKRGE